MADYNPNQWASPAELKHEAEVRKKAFQDASYETYKENIEFSLAKRLDDLTKEKESQEFVESQKETGYWEDAVEPVEENLPEVGVEMPEMYEYEVIYRVVAYNPMHAAAIAQEANNIEVRLKPYGHTH